MLWRVGGAPYRRLSIRWLSVLAVSDVTKTCREPFIDGFQLFGQGTTLWALGKRLTYYQVVSRPGFTGSRQTQAT